MEPKGSLPHSKEFSVCPLPLSPTKPELRGGNNEICTKRVDCITERFYVSGLLSK
jgi:hypothetical protein